MKKLAAAILPVLFAIAAHGQQIRASNSVKIYHELAQMRNLVNVLYVAAHPDDENTRLLAWLVNERNVRTGYLSLTRGDGGQNILGTEQGDALGLIRTHELMEARKIDGAEQYFTRAVDFGFSKNFEETFKHWDKDSLVSDAVWVIREFRPDIIICRFPPDTMAGHGHHAASAVIGRAAFEACGNAAMYPAQIPFRPAFQPVRLVFNAYRFGSFSTQKENMFKVPVGQYEPLLGMGTGELAGISRSVHKSQGAGTPGVAGVQNEYFKLVAGMPFTNSLFDGIDTTWSRVGHAEIDVRIAAVQQKFDFLHPDRILPDLVEIRKMIETVSDNYWRKEKLEEMDRLILDCAGILVEVVTKQATAVAGTGIPLSVHIAARAADVSLVSVRWAPGSDTTINHVLGSDSLYSFDHYYNVPLVTSVTEPYWLQQPSANGRFEVPNRAYLGLPETPTELTVTIVLDIAGYRRYLEVPVSCKKLDPLKGDVVEPLRIVPRAVLAFQSDPLMIGADGMVTADVHIHAYDAVHEGELSIMSGSTQLAQITNLMLDAGNDTTVTFKLNLKAVKPGEGGCILLNASLQDGRKVFDRTVHNIQYSHLPALQYFTAASAKAIHPNWKVLVKHVGYIEGAGDFVPNFLKLAGIEVDMLKEADLANAAKLKKYDAIVTGIRAVNVEKRMAVWMPVLMEYVKAGGTLVMQYNTLQDLATTKIGPYPMTLSGKRVTEEDAEMTFLDPKDKLVNLPNKLGPDDFKGWVQERGLYFPGTWDAQYKPVFSMHDLGEQPLLGSVLTAKYGKGNYIYTSLSFSRQLPAGNIGAARLFMNMLSIGK